MWGMMDTWERCPYDNPLMPDSRIHVEPAGLTPLERGVMGYLLKGDDPTLEILRRQFSAATVVGREYTGVGFFAQFAVDSMSPRIPATQRITLGDVIVEFPRLKHGAGFVLFIDQGAINMLEGFTYDEAWPDQIADFKLSYWPGENRDLEAVRKQWQ